MCYGSNTGFQACVISTKILHLGSFISLQEREFLCIRLLPFFIIVFIFGKSQATNQLGALDYIFLYKNFSF